MRYILLNQKISNDEIISRKEYIYDVFKVYTIPFRRKEILELRSIPENSHDIVFIHGHNNDVFWYLAKCLPYEKNIGLITCFIGWITRVNIPNKQLFFTDRITNKYDGRKYGFNFNITEAELNLYNSKEKSVYNKMVNSFRIEV